MSGFLFCDLETAGLQPNKHCILQAALVVTDEDFNVDSRWMSYVRPNPDLEIDPKALEINNLDPQRLENSPTEEFIVKMFDSIARAYNGLRFAGFRCSFDYGFVAMALARNGMNKIPTLMPWFDVYDLAKRKIKGLKNYKLTTIAEHLGIETEGAHDALFDLGMTIEVARLLSCA